MKGVKGILNYIFVDGLSGMALGLFATLIIGTILEQIGGFITGTVGTYIILVASVAKSLTGAGIGVGMAFKYKMSPLVGVSAAVAGMVGAFASKLVAGAVVTDAGMLYSGPGDPLAAFIAAFFAIQAGSLISGKTKLDILLTPAVSIIAGSAAGIFIGPPASKVTTYIGEIISWGMERQPVLMGIVVSVVMGICLTLPISSAAIGIILGLSGIAGGAAVAGCCAQMVGFAVISFRENKWGGIISQGLGTSMLQMGNICKNPRIWIPPTLAAAIVGPLSTMVFKLYCTGVSAGMGTCGLVGPIGIIADTKSSPMMWTGLILCCIVLPAALSLLFSEILRKIGWIKKDDMLLTE